MLLNALLENVFLFTVKGAVELGNAITLLAKPAFKLAETIGAKYNPFAFESMITTCALSFSAACFTIFATILALKGFNALFAIVNTFSAP